MNRPAVDALSPLFPPPRSAWWLAAFLTSISGSLSAQRPHDRFDLDAAHSEVAFTVRFMGVSNVRGAFSDVSGTLMLAGDDLVGSSVTAVIRAASINTNNATRDRDLQSPSFFDAEKHPVITFRSTRIARAGAGLVMRGQLTMRGVTREISLPVTQAHGRTLDAWGNNRIGFEGAVTLNRKDFGILGTQFWNSEFDPGRMSVGDSVRIQLVIEGVQQNMDKVGAPRADSLVAAIKERGAAAVLSQYRAAAGSDPALHQASQVMLVNAGRKLAWRGQGAAAIETFKLATELHPASALAFALLGDAERVAGQKGAAATHFAKALTIDPDNALALEGSRATR